MDIGNLTLDFSQPGTLLNCSNLTEYSQAFNISNCTYSEVPNNESYQMHFVISLISQISLFIVFAVGLFGNTLVIYVVAKFSKMQTVTNRYILNLAIADDLFVIGIPFLIATSYYGYWPFGSFLCKFYMIITSMNQFSSSMFLTILSVDRYIAVCHPIPAQNVRTHMVAKLSSIGAWVIVAILCIPIFIYAYEDPMPHSGLKNCNLFWPSEYEKIFTISTFITAFAIPVLAFVICYSFVLVKLKTLGPTNRTADKKKNLRKVTRMVLTVIAVYVFCFTPYWVMQISLMFSPPGTVQSNMMVICFLTSSLLTYINSAINPILYAFLSDNFKKSFLQAFKCLSDQEMNNFLRFETSILHRKTRGKDAQKTCTSRRTSITNDMVSKATLHRQTLATHVEIPEDTKNVLTLNRDFSVENEEMNYDFIPMSEMEAKPSTVLLENSYIPISDFEAKPTTVLLEKKQNNGVHVIGKTEKDLKDLMSSEGCSKGGNYSS